MGSITYPTKQVAPDTQSNGGFRSGGGNWGAGKTEILSGAGTSFAPIQDPLAQIAERIGQLKSKSARNSPATSSPFYDNAVNAELDPLEDLLKMYTRSKFGEPPSFMDDSRARHGSAVAPSRAAPGGFQGIGHQQATFNPPPVRRSAYATKYEALLEELQMQQLQNALKNAQGNSQDDGLRQDRINTMRRFLQAAQPYKG